MAAYKLSKSTFIRGLQCEKSLYLYKHHYNLRDATPESRQAIFDQGTAVGILAQELFPKGVDASPEDYTKIADSVAQTLAFINQGESIIYEATFMYNDVLAALDILVKDADGWKAYEVKSSTKVSETYLRDAAIQYYTIINSGIDLKDISIVHINNQYVRQGALDIQQLFTIESVHKQVLDFLPQIPDKVERFKQVIAQPQAPQVEIGLHCSNPYDCDFKGTCWKHIPEYSVFDIANLRDPKKFDLYNQGVLTFDQIDFGQVKLSANQELQVQAEINNTTFINEVAIREFVGGLQYPLYYLDFETFGAAVPLYDNSRPYQHLVFQYSLHRQESAAATLEHSEYLADATDDPRIGFVKQLIQDCGSEGDILVYNINFERGKLKDLAAIFPQYAQQINDIINRLKDLMLPFQKRWYYSPAMKGSYSIKYVLPALVPELSYADLDIQEGGTASNTFLAMASGTFKGDVDTTRQQLLDYCKLDTLAMVKILEKLKEV